MSGIDEFWGTLIKQRKGEKIIIEMDSNTYETKLWKLNRIPC